MPMLAIVVLRREAIERTERDSATDDAATTCKQRNRGTKGHDNIGNLHPERRDWDGLKIRYPITVFLKLLSTEFFHTECPATVLSK